MAATFTTGRRWDSRLAIQEMLSYHGCSGRFAMASGNCDTVFEPHELGKQLAMRDDQDLRPPCLRDLRIIESRADVTTSTSFCLRLIARVMSNLDGCPGRLSRRRSVIAFAPGCRTRTPGNQGIQAEPLQSRSSQCHRFPQGDYVLGLKGISPPYCFGFKKLTVNVRNRGISNSFSGTLFFLVGSRLSSIHIGSSLSRASSSAKRFVYCCLYGCCLAPQRLLRDEHHKLERGNTVHFHIREYVRQLDLQALHFFFALVIVGGKQQRNQNRAFKDIPAGLTYGFGTSAMWRGSTLSRRCFQPHVASKRHHPPRFTVMANS